MKRIHSLFVVASIAVASGFVAIENASTAPVDLVARAANQELSVERLASLMATSTVPIQKDVAAAVTDFWVSYQLLAYAGAHGDMLTDSTTTNWWLKDTKIIDDAMWSRMLDARGRVFFEKVARTIAMPDTTNLEQNYETSQLLAAQHILIQFPENGAGMTQATQDSIRRSAEDLRKRVTSANFAALAKEFSKDPGSKDNGGSYAMFGPGTNLEMVPEFDQAVRKAKPGEIVPGLVRTQFGFHIIRRHTLAEVRPIFINALVRANVGPKGQQYVAKLREDWKFKVLPVAIAKARAVGANPSVIRGDRTVIATSLAGDFTAGRLAEWIEVVPDDIKIRERLVQAPDSIVLLTIQMVVDQEIIQAQAMKEGVEIDPEELVQIRHEFESMMTFALTGLRVDPKSLRDSARTPAERERLAARRIEDALDHVFATNGKDLVEVPPQLAAALRKRYGSRTSPESMAVAVQRAIAVRAALDSTRAKAPGMPAGKK
jgi:hypothetical protein